MAQEREPLTIDDLASIYRVEIKSKSLSEIRKDFYPAVASLSETVQKEYETELQKDSSSIFSEGINERRKKILLHSRNIVDLRMEKITKLALLGSMGGDNAVDHLTQEEKEYYAAVLDMSKKHRSLIEPSKSRPKTVTLNVEPVKAIKETKVEEEQEEIPEPPIIIEEPKPIVEEVQPKIEIAEEEEYAEAAIEGETVTIRILEDLPRFSGPDMDYDLKKEDIIRMPAVMANALIIREKAVKVNVTP